VTSKQQRAISLSAFELSPHDVADVRGLPLTEGPPGPGWGFRCDEQLGHALAEVHV